MDWINVLLKFIAISTAGFLILNRIISVNLPPTINKALFGAGFVSLISAVLFTANIFVDEPLRTAIIIVVSSLLLSAFTREKFEITLTSFTIVYAVSYLLYILAVSISILIIPTPFRHRSKRKRVGQLT